MKEKIEFIKSEIWILTIGGAFQRANIYNESATEKTKSEFRGALFNHVNALTNNYQVTVSDDKHLENIWGISTFSKAYAHILKNGELIFGVAQKLLNLYLKYLWCMNELPIAPPHFPVDSIIQKKLKCETPCAWTQMKDDIQYIAIINHAKELAKARACSIAELELKDFSRRNTNG